MATAQDALNATGQAISNIWREPSGWVSIQTAAPYQDGRYTNSYVQHCGISVGYTYTLAGLVMGRDFPDLAYTPTGAQATFDGGFAVETPAPGDYGIIDWNWNGWGATGASDHAVLIVGTDNFPNSVSTLEWNTTDDGRARYYERDTGLFVVFGRPKFGPSGPVTGAWLEGGPVGIADLQPGSRNTSVARVQDAIINNTNVNDPVMNRFQVDQQFLLNYARWQSLCGFSGDDADGVPGRQSLERLGFQVVDGSTLTPPGPPQLAGEWASTAQKYASVLGKNTTGVVKFLGSGPDCVAFTGGIIISINGTLVPVYGAMFARWSSGAGTLLGLPQEAEQDVPGVPRARWQKFANGYLVWNPDTGAACVVYGDILARYLTLTPAERGMLGYITSDEGNTIPAGRWNSFVGGGIVWRKDLGAHPVWGQMARTYLASGGTRGLGFPTAQATAGPAAGWVTQPFTNGTIAVKG